MVLRIVGILPKYYTRRYNPEDHGLQFPPPWKRQFSILSQFNQSPTLTTYPSYS